ncbi:hypothetical protein GIB67_006421 [Kingdonia uniflora]|uniref:SCP domain-containing protein n=1 Tax=Kingdonia uniflora TaxID=39325 RepID=A0A7J7P0T1_9MAGN|nr:hypothetical protein GIB67_006421 [Kingdonia uniflora]
MFLTDAFDTPALRVVEGHSIDSYKNWSGHNIERTNWEFLHEHNKVRRKNGEPLLTWDRTLARYARRWAAKRVANCDMVHSNGPYGENVYWGSDYTRHSAADAVRAWAGETRHFNAHSNSCAPNQLCGHYTQIVWASSKRIGCARVKCNNGGVYIMCSYDPRGNIIDVNPFDVTMQFPFTPLFG